MNLKAIPWDEFFKIERAEYVTFRITPDSGARNWRTEDITKTIADQFKLPIDRVRREGYRFRYTEQDRASFEIAFEGGRVRFYLSVPKVIAPLMKRRIQSVWGGATAEEVTDYRAGFEAEKTAVYEVLYRKHDMYSIHTDSKDNLPLESLFEGGRLVGEGERARVFAFFDPIHQLSYQTEMNEIWRRLRKGHSPKKLTSSGRDVAMIVLVGMSYLIKECVEMVSEIFGGDKKENIYHVESLDPQAARMSIERLRMETKTKPTKAATRTYLWVLAESPEPVRADLIARTLASSFGDLSGDNELYGRAVRGKVKAEVLQVVETKQAPRIKITYNLMSTAETAKIVQLPGRELQDKYSEIDRNEVKEIEIESGLTKGGMYLGEATFKGVRTKIYQPADDWDELCAPHIVIAGMGQGKTKGYAANWLVEAVRNGFGGLAIDPAKGEIGDEVEAALTPDKVLRINLAQTVFSLDWCEVLRSPRAKNRLANTIIGFFDSGGDDTGGQTARFIRAAVMGMQTGKLAEILRIFEDEKYRKKIIAEMNEGIHKSTLKQFQAEGEGRQRQILSPIYNRMDIILGDEFLEECLNSDNALDMVDILSQRKAVIFDVPKRDLGAEGVDLLVNLLTTKIDLAMTLREEEKQFPFFVIVDEPHQYNRSHVIWKKAVVESRKWRVGYIWLFHEWMQMDRELRRIIRGALPHYHFYPTSKDIWKDVLEEIAPHDLEGALRLKRYHAINVIRAGGQVVTPFIASMAAPPSMRRVTTAAENTLE